MKKVFATFSTSDWVGTRTRLKFQALESGWFDEVLDLDEKKIGNIDQKYPDRWKLPMHGYYFWKPIAIMFAYNKLQDGDVLVFADAGSSINLSGWRQFNEKMKLLEKYSMFGYGMTSIRAFTDKEVYKACGLKDEDITEDLLNWPQIQVNQLYIKKCPASTKILMRWRKICIDHPEALIEEFTDSPKRPQLEGFVQARPEQSVLGIIQYQNKDDFAILKPNTDYAINYVYKYGKALRVLDSDIVPTRKTFNYKPYVSFVIGHVLPFFETDYDDYTHFINVGDRDLHRMTDKTGDNIHELKGLAELTGIYWIWKNLDLSDVKYISISTYRKPFLISNSQAWDFLSKKQYNAIAMRYYQNRIRLHKATFLTKTLDQFYDTFKKYHPNDLEAFKQYQKQGYFYPCNSFITSVDNFKKLCEYIFPVMLDFGKQTEGEMGTTIHSHAEHCPPAGVFAEDIVSFYLEKFIGKIYSSPVVIYPKEGELYNFELQQIGMIFGTGTFDQDGREQELFFPAGVHPRNKPIVTPNRYGSKDSFYPDDAGPMQLPFIIQTNCVKVTPNLEQHFREK